MPYPDLFVAFDADPAGYLARNGYVISEQGKPPDFALEIASRSTGRRDTVDKRISYAALGIQEYWRFDATGQFHGTRLAGDRLVSGQYEPLPIEELTDGSLQGYSAILNLNLRWTEGQLGWYDPNADEHIPTLDDAEARANAAEAEYGSWKTNSANCAANDHLKQPARQSRPSFSPREPGRRDPTLTTRPKFPP